MTTGDEYQHSRARTRARGRAAPPGCLYSVARDQLALRQHHASADPFPPPACATRRDACECARAAVAGAVHAWRPRQVPLDVSPRVLRRQRARSRADWPRTAGPAGRRHGSGPLRSALPGQKIHASWCGRRAPMLLVRLLPTPSPFYSCLALLLAHHAHTSTCN